MRRDSDTVTSSLLGYGIGKLFHNASRVPVKGMPQVMVSPSDVQLGWTLP